MASSKPSLALFTDLYELTMAQAYWQSSETAQATFSLYIRNYPPDRGYFVLGGIQDALDYLKDLQFSEDETRYLRSLDLFDPDFLEFLPELRFTGTVRAMDEGTIFFANEPVIEVTAPIIEAQIAETCLLNQVNLQSVLATKAARVVHAARPRRRRRQQVRPYQLHGRLRGHQQRPRWQSLRDPRLRYHGPLIRRGVPEGRAGPSRLRRVLPRQQHLSRRHLRHAGGSAQGRCAGR